MSWLFSQALAEEYLPATYLDGELSAQSKCSPMRRVFCSPAKTKDTSRLSRYGMTCELLTATHGAALLTSFLAAFPVKISVAQAREKAWQASEAACSTRCCESSTKCSHATSSRKTCRRCERAAWQPFSKKLPRAGIAQRGTFLERNTAAPPIGENAFGYWLPTPTKVCILAERKSAPRAKSLPWALGGLPNPVFLEWLMGWPEEWTATQPLETDRFHAWLRAHSSLCKAF